MRSEYIFPIEIEILHYIKQHCNFIRLLHKTSKTSKIDEEKEDEGRKCSFEGDFILNFYVQ